MTPGYIFISLWFSLSAGAQSHNHANYPNCFYRLEYVVCSHDLYELCGYLTGDVNTIIEEIIITIQNNLQRLIYCILYACSMQCFDGNIRLGKS